MKQPEVVPGNTATSPGYQRAPLASPSKTRKPPITDRGSSVRPTTPAHTPLRFPENRQITSATILNGKLIILCFF